MKHHKLQASLFVGLMLAAVLVLVPAASACSQYYQLSNKTLDCDRASELMFDFEYDLLEGSTIHTTINWNSETESVPPMVDETTTLDAEETNSGTINVDVPADGMVEYTVNVFGPEGDQIYAMYIYAECPSGDLRYEHPEAEEPGILPPASNEATMGTVVANTPLYSAPDYEALLPDYELEAGQTWFVICQMEDEDGNLWYKIFVGSKNYAYVPAEAVLLGGPLPQ
jgi:hypothetical protein